jgi:hypothetical protein
MGTTVMTAYRAEKVLERSTTGSRRTINKSQKSEKPVETGFSLGKIKSLDGKNQIPETGKYNVAAK